MTMFNVANQANLDAARVGFHAAFLEMLGLVNEEPLEELLQEVQSTTNLEEWDWLGDFPGLEEWDDDRVMAVMKAFKLRVQNRDFSSGIRMHQNQFKDDKLGLFGSQVAGLAQAAGAHKAEFTAQLAINGFDGALFPKVSNGLGYDGKFFFSATHATGSNKLTVALAADGVALDTAEVMLGSQTSYDGKRKLRGIRGTHLVVGPKNAPLATRLMTSDYIIDATAVGPVSNPYKGRYKVIVEPQIAKGTAYEDMWFLASRSTPFKPFLYQNREDISTSAIIGGQGTSNDSLPRFQKGEIWFGAEARRAVAYWEHRTIVGSKP